MLQSGQYGWTDSGQRLFNLFAVDSQAVDHVCDCRKRLGPIFERRKPLPELSGSVVKTRRQAGGVESCGDFFHFADIAPSLWGCYSCGLLATALQVRL